LAACSSKSQTDARPASHAAQEEISFEDLKIKYKKYYLILLEKQFIQ
jgi:hypothetical protein